MQPRDKRDLLLLIDTCGEHGTVALFEGEHLAHEVTLPERTASAALLGAVREVLGTAAVSLRDLTGLGVVNGPGSFTGLRVGLAVAKGLCEAASLPIAAISRLAVLAHAAAIHDGLSALRAGGDAVYVREQVPGQPSREFLVKAASFGSIRAGRISAYAEDSLLPMLTEQGFARKIEFSAKDAYFLVREALAAGGHDLATLDANYVRDEQAIYSRQHATT